MSLANVQQLPTPLGTIAVRNHDGARWLQIPISHPGNRAFLLSLAINNDERNALALPSHDIEVRMTGNMSVQEFVASIIRRSSYFIAIIIQSRGRTMPACASKCATSGSPRFRECSHGARCSHRGQEDGSSDSSGGSNHSDNDDDDESPRRSNYRKPYARGARQPDRTPGRKLGRGVGTSGSFLGSSHNPQLIEKE
nr:uncharacterized protein CTRU02_15765 [Colletotrichum truncatum]XP_036585437.1 uncharacterized protein CTRU02_04298 [Colletotrichum truncatum]KAF6780692.1 hypothetical protein CTRU02_15765 [Colletotrichum truncatum]KAF6795488.1 hypothetical protein CTRU02_04298 [Colletotrichum truncatum]